MAQTDVRNYFRDLLELGSDPSLSIDEKISRAIAVGRDRLEVSYGLLSYTGAGEYEVIDSSISDGTYVAGSTHDLDTTWCRHVVGDRELLAIADAESSAHADDIARDVTNLQCYIGAPVVVDGETYGTLCYSGEDPREEPFGSDEKRFVRLLARWISYELEREKHYQVIDRQNERLNEFAGILAHDLRNPLTTASGYTDLVAESASGKDAEYLQIAQKSLDRIETLISDTLMLARDGNDVGAREPVELEAVARNAWQTVDPTDATLTIEHNRVVRADESRLTQLFENLFRNADEHCGPDVTVTVHGTEQGFVVADDGPGLPSEIAESLFSKAPDPSRVGLGLLIVERIVSGHGWKGAVEVDDGTRFAFTGLDQANEIPSIKQ